MPEYIKHVDAETQMDEGHVLLKAPYAMTAFDSWWSENYDRVVMSLGLHLADKRAVEAARLVFQEAFGSGWYTLAKDRTVHHDAASREAVDIDYIYRALRVVHDGNVPHQYRDREMRTPVDFAHAMLNDTEIRWPR